MMWRSLLSLALIIACWSSPTEAVRARVAERDATDNQHRQFVRAAPTMKMKKGISLTVDRVVGPFQGKVGWATLSDSKRPESVPAEMQYIPLLWNFVNETDLASWKAEAPEAIKRGDNVFFGSPSPSSACMPSKDHREDCARFGAEQYRTHVTSLKEIDPNIVIVGPEISIRAPPNDGGIAGGPEVEKLRQFLEACKDCKIDALAFRWSSQWTDIELLKTLIESVRSSSELLKLPVWITAFDLPENDGTAVEGKREFIRQAIEYAEGNPDVQGYSWPYRDLVQVNNDVHELNDLGKAYVGE